MEGKPPDSAPPESAAVAKARRTASDTEATVAILLAVAAVLAALIGARAALVGDSGSDTWYAATREDIKRGAGMVEDVRFVYSEEAPAALAILEGEVRARELRRAARRQGGLLRDLLAAEAAAQAKLADTNRSASTIARDRKYATGQGGYDVLKRLVDRRAEHPDLVRLDPDATEARGSDRTKKSALLIAATILVAVAFFLGALAEGFSRWRRRLVPAGFVFAGLGLVTALIVEVSL